MAEGNSVGGLYLRLGLSLSELETGFVTAERTVVENIRRLNRESDLIRIRSEIEIAGLDETEDAERILQIRTEALNRQMAIQRDRVRILTAELQSLTAAHGENSTVAQRAAVRLERERLTLANLERDLRSLNDAQGESNNSFGGLSDVLKILPPQLQAVAKGIGAITAGAGAAAVSVNTLLADFKELQKQAFELNMSVGKTRDFLLQLRLGGGEITDFEGYIRGITDALVKGEIDDPEFVALRKYGAQITDVTGRLKDFKDITEEVYQAWKKADAAGEGIEFLQLSGGEQGVRDAIQFFKRYEEAKEDAQKVMKAGIDDSQLHELDRVMKLVEEQAGELKNALGDIFVPAAQSAAEGFFETLHKGTEFLVENKDALQKWGFVAKEVFDTIEDEIKGAFSTAGNKIAEVNEMLKGKTGDKRVDKILGDMSWRYGGTQPAYGIDKMISGQVESAKKSLGVLDEFIKRGEQAQAEYNAEVSKTSELWQKVVKTISGGDKNPLSQYALQRVQSFKDELANLRIDLDFDSEIEKSKARLDLWLDQELTRKLFVSDDERSVIKELYAAKLDAINQEQAEIIQGYLKNAADLEFEMTHTAFEKQLRDIEQWRDAQAKKAATAEETAAIIAEAAAKEAQAFENEMDRIRGKLQSLDDKIFEIDHSQYENDLRRIQQDYVKQAQEYQELDIFTPEIKAKLDYFYNRQKQNLDKRASESRAKGGDYTKAPEGASSFGGNGIMVIGADQIIDDGLIRGQQQAIGLLTDENRIRSMLLPKLDAEAREAVERIQSLKEMTATQNNFVQQTKQAANDFELILGDQIARIQPTFQGASVGDKTIIQGDQVTQISLPDLKAEMEKYMTPLTQLQTQTAPEGATDYLTPLSNIDGKMQSVLQEMQSRQPVTLETVVTPLNNIEQVLGNIATALSNQQAPQINISPNNNVNLGGAYVFDNAMKQELVSDITSQIVDTITTAVQQATSRSSFSYGS